MRLFGNMYAGELIFILIALMTLSSSLAHLSTWLLGPLQFRRSPSGPCSTS